jgi:hypothetical protein
MVFNATFNNISAILCQSVLLVVETRIYGENHRPDTSHWQSLSEKHRQKYYWMVGWDSRSICFLLPQSLFSYYLNMVVGYMTTYSISAYHQ